MSHAMKNRKICPPIPHPSSPSLGNCPNCEGQIRACFAENVEDYTCDRTCGFWISNLDVFFTDVPYISQPLMCRLLTETTVILDDLENSEGKRKSAKVMLVPTAKKNRWEVAIEAVEPHIQNRKDQR